MAFKFIVKDEDLPKPTVLALVHLVSIFLGMPAIAGVNNNSPYFKDIPPLMIVFIVSEFLQIIYMFTFYKKIVWERYTNTKLRAVTISFIATNVFLGILSILQLKYGALLSMVPLIISTLTVFFIVIPFTIFLRKKDFLTSVKTLPVSIQDFSFPFYKIAGIIPMFLVLPSILFKSKVYLGISLALLVMGMLYAGIGEYFYTKKKDELDRLVKYEASFFAMQLMPALFLPLFMMEAFWKIQIPWFYALMLFSIIHALIQTVINRRYE
ncbi:MAG: hypothetical protein HYZ10_14665 [Ignavibacteriales bacterium]|nr:hypothetical protein [Ignavibacteriales bacterium]